MISKNAAVVCLSHQLDVHNQLSNDSLKRLNMACKIYKEKKCAFLVTTGWAYKKELKKPLSSIMAEHAHRNFKIPLDRIFQEPKAKDTVGEAYFIKKNFFLNNKNLKKFHIVTSDWHLERAKEIFKFIFGLSEDPKLNFYPIEGDQTLKEKEKRNKSIIEFRKMMKSCNRGDLSEIYYKMNKYHSLYKE